jgi:hypothetical protein
LLSLLVSSFIELAIDNPDLTVMGVRERRHLTRSTRRWLERYDRQHRMLWESALLQARPGLTAGEAHVMVSGAVSLIVGAVAGKTPLQRDELADLVESMVIGALGLPRAPRARTR